MQLFLGDRVTIMKDETLIEGQTRGIILDANGKIERIYIQAIEGSFFMRDGWKFLEEDEEEELEDE
jgi:hypothetical protein